MHDVVITGMGVVSSLAMGAEEFGRAILAGKSGLRPLTRICTEDLPCKIGGEIPDDWIGNEQYGPNVARQMDRASRYAVHASREALLTAGLPIENLGRRIGIVIGAGLSGLDTLQTQTERLLTKGAGMVSPFTIPTLMPNAAPANVSLAFGVTGPCYTVSSACASSGHALIDAVELIRRGACDIVITGGTESSLTRLGMAAFAKMRALSSNSNDNPAQAVRPFDLNREGLVMSEGAGIVVLESAEHAQSRNASVRARVLGYGMTTDASNIVRPDATGVEPARAMQEALASAGLNVDDVAGRMYVNAHGTGTSLNDATETRALKLAFGEHAANLQVSSTKSMTGHLIGAACGLETVACLIALQQQTLPPTINYETPDPECDLDYIPNVARAASVEFALNNSFGFGGHNVSLLLGRA
ncbi:MAG: beta-ketoacyl-[acyl-carrier-protein] synthase II [Planctomycetaceae bacterium]|nr:beta-ketoacyl-[acyl-carrier-protein] synthase II [Planctomycetaceae bacterium]MCB9953501.1 beta-ketoacyl-[acyl-carrier-protein] synthase II [Planctomycetaceae bacterium]